MLNMQMLRRVLGHMLLVVAFFGTWSQFTSKAHAANWGDFQDDGCIAIGLRKYSSILWNISGSWENACAVQPATIQGHDFMAPTRCVNTGGHMWGEFEVPDSTCTPYWGSFEVDSCSRIGVRQRSAILWNIPNGVSWEDACAVTPAVIDGVAYAAPNRCVNTVTNIWGQFDTYDDSCNPTWGAIQANECVDIGVRRESAVLNNIPAGVSWEDTCARWPVTIAGQYFPRPARCVNTSGINIWGEWLVSDPGCNPSWGEITAKECDGIGLRKYSAVLNDIPSGVSWEATCERWPASVNGLYFSMPSRCVNHGLNIWGEWEIADSTCYPAWGDITAKECVTTGVRKYSGVLQNIPAGVSWEATCANWPADFIDRHFDRPARCVNTDGLNMWGEWDIQDDGCPHWGPFRKLDCDAGRRSYSAVLWDVPADSTWEAACGAEPAVVLGQPFPNGGATCMNTGTNIWGTFQVTDPTCVGSLVPIYSDVCEQNNAAEQKPDLALFNVSLHHGHDTNGIPDEDEVDAAADRISELWSDPDSLLVVIPAGPPREGTGYPSYLASINPTCTAPRYVVDPIFGASCLLPIDSSDVFVDRLRQVYGDYPFQYSVTDTSAYDTQLMHSESQAIIAGRNWTVASVQRFFYPTEYNATEGRSFGDFELQGFGMSFHVIVAQTQANDDIVKKKQLNALLDYAEAHHGSEPSFIVGDFNWGNDQDQPFAGQLAMRADWMTHDQACDNRRAHIFSAPDIMNIVRMNGTTKLTRMGFVLSPDTGDGVITMPSLNHSSMGALFRVERAGEQGGTASTDAMDAGTPSVPNTPIRDGGAVDASNAPMQPEDEPTIDGPDAAQPATEVHADAAVHSDPESKPDSGETIAENQPNEPDTGALPTPQKAHHHGCTVVNLAGQGQTSWGWLLQVSLLVICLARRVRVGARSVRG